VLERWRWEIKVGVRNAEMVKVYATLVEIRQRKVVVIGATTVVKKTSADATPVRKSV
jgi:hypothetical protein